PNKTKISNHISYVIVPSLILVAIINDVIITLKTIITPPIVGVPDFFKCDLGPSSRILCPNFSRRKNGMNKGDNRTVIKNAMANVMTIIIIFISIYLLSVLQPSL